MNWISVKERHAPPLHTVLIAYGRGRITVGWNEAVQPEEETKYYSCEHRNWPNKVTHWMELPKSPMIKEPHFCSKCNKGESRNLRASYDDEYDAYYCKKCDRWLEPRCGHKFPECWHKCCDRPDKPSMIARQKLK